MRQHARSARIVPLALAALFVGGLSATTAAPAQARTEAQASAKVSDAHYLRFNKGSVTNSRLELVKRTAGTDKVIKRYKAGSGQSKDTCAVGRGWLPNAGASKPYAIEWHRKNFDGIINGLVIKIADRKCHNGTKRTELFIHSEMKPNGKSGVIESERWTNSNPNDYYSNGCIKLNPTDIRDLFKRLDSVGWPKKLYVVN
ncbi:L,D-transpeptidase family protein [Streptomyces sp. BE230]|uniref:L,D-transpeptidase family protein n=1 Tax=Streptomyces sp. BE230 TaxID=3002526 RepID=UPI002ED2BA56|nr:L,D-transpeptidase family protein [Streptomyces sp. BE230]